MSTLTIRRGTPADEEAIVELQKASLGEGVIPRSLAFWRWKHVQNPFGPSPVLLAFDGDRLVGLRAFMRWEWRAGGMDFKAVRAVDTATHPEYQGRGIFKTLTLALRDEMAAEGVHFVYNTPNEQSRPGYVKMGWSTVGRPTLWARPVRPLRLYSTLRKQGLDGDEGESPPVDAERAIDVMARWDEVECFTAAVSGCSGFHTMPSTRTLRWRYADIPGFDYRASQLGVGDASAAIIFRARRRGDLRELRICHALCGPNGEARRNLGRLLRGAVRRADVDVAFAMLPPIRTGGRVLGLSGYLPVRSTGPLLTAYPLRMSEGAPDPASLIHWRATVGDLEVF